MKHKTPKVGDLVRYRQRKRSNVYGFVTEQKGNYSIKVHVFNNKDEWFQQGSFWDESHWEVISESA
tara:strand:+ start:84 stop:281 length:198 start_codon:yes stop_codon:yes gene_type:complete